MKLHRANSVKSGVARLKPKDQILVVCPRLLHSIWSGMGLVPVVEREDGL